MRAGKGETGLDRLFPAEEKKKISRVAFAFFAMLVVATVIQIAAALLLSAYAPEITEKTWYVWALSMIPIYVFGLPVCLAVIKKVPAREREKHSMTFGQFMVALVMCFGIMYPLSIVGNLLNMLFGALSGRAVNPVEAAVSSSTPLMTILFAVVLGPILEELLFRGLIVGRMRRYGDKAAILFSATLFAFYHGNFSQLFYAFGLGLFFAFIYARTGKLRYTMGLHMIINFIGSVVSSFVVGKIDLERLQQNAFSALEGGVEGLRSMAGSIGPMLLLALYSQVLLGLCAAGIILLIVKRRRFVCQPGPVEIPKGRMFSSLYLNPGFILFFIASLALIVMSMIGI